MNCPSCGRETLPGETCAHCGATLSPQRRLPLGLFKWGSLFLAVAGVVALILSASRAAVPQVTIGQLNATTNLAYVRVTGIVVTVPRYDASTNFLSFHLDDGTGDLSVNSYRTDTQTLIANNQFPSLGDRITLEGTLRLREESASLTLAAPERLVIERPTPAERVIASITTDDENTLVTVRGQIQDRREPFPGLTVLVVADPTGVIDASIPLDVVSLTGPVPALTTGDFVQLTAAVTLYRNTPQLTVTSTQNILKLDALPEPIPTPTVRPTAVPRASAIGHITLVNIGQTFILEANLIEAEDFSAGKRFTLDDGTGSIILLLWQDIYDSFESHEQLIPGARVRVTGDIAEFNGELEIIPVRSSDLSLIP